VTRLVREHQGELEVSVHLGGNLSKLDVLRFVNQWTPRVLPMGTAMNRNSAGGTRIGTPPVLSVRF
jgi:hypothetical protein